MSCSQCDPAESLKALFDALWAGPRYLLVFGGVCPSVTALIARALPALHLVQVRSSSSSDLPLMCLVTGNFPSFPMSQVSFAASSPSLSNRKWYGNLFSTAPSDRALNQATVKLLQHYSWNRVGIITQEGTRLSEVNDSFSSALNPNNDLKVQSVRYVYEFSSKR